MYKSTINVKNLIGSNYWNTPRPGLQNWLRRVKSILIKAYPSIILVHLHTIIFCHATPKWSVLLSYFLSLPLANVFFFNTEIFENTLLSTCENFLKIFQTLFWVLYMWSRYWTYYEKGVRQASEKLCLENVKFQFNGWKMPKMC